MGWKEACSDLARMVDHAWLRHRIPEKVGMPWDTAIWDTWLVMLSTFGLCWGEEVLKGGSVWEEKDDDDGEMRRGGGGGEYVVICCSTKSWTRIAHGWLLYPAKAC